MSVVRRLDSGTLRQPQVMPNGWLRVDGFLTRTGVFTYGMPDGTKRREYRPPEEVFKADSLATFELVPVTDEHPPEFLTAANTANYAKGAVAGPRADGSKVLATFLVTDSALIEKMKSGQQQVSCGYVCDLEDASGITPDGEKYDAVQRNIRGNHVAIVPIGRAGPEVRVRMDAAELEDERSDSRGANVSTDRGIDPPTNPAPSATRSTAMSKIRLDGVDFDPSTEAFAQALEKRDAKIAADVAALKAQVTESTEKADKAEARADAAAEALAKAQAEIKELPAKLRADMAARAELDAKARAVLGKDAKLDALSPADVRRLVLAKLTPDVKIDGKSEAYVEARFDAAIEAAEKQDGEWERDADKLDSKETDSSPRKVDSEEARAQFMKSSKDAWKKPLSSVRDV